MNLDNAFPYGIAVLFAFYIVWRAYKMNQIRKDLPRLFDQGAVVIDVRTKAEFSQAANPKSINIPLDQLEKRIKELDPTKPIVLCCASGGRSGMAASILRDKGFERVFNAGSWSNTL